MAKCKSPIGMYVGHDGKATMFSKQMQRPLLWLYDLDCGKCVNCRIRKSGELSARVMLECRSVDEIADKMGFGVANRPLFITLTYDEDHLPDDELVSKKRLQKFFLDLKKIYPARYIACGEYGDRTHRPHYHAIIWPFTYLDAPGLSFDKVNNDAHYPCYSSPAIERLWPEGQMRINLCTPETISYVAGYVIKKMSGSKKFSDWVTRSGEVVKRDSGFIIYSLRPGIGAYISDELCKQFLRDGHLLYRGKILPLPRYIKIVLSRRFPLEYDEMIERLVASANKEKFVADHNAFLSDQARSKIAESLKSLYSDSKL